MKSDAAIRVISVNFIMASNILYIIF